MDVSELEAATLAKTETALIATEGFLASQQLKKATESANIAAFGHRELNRLLKRRRGNPREELRLKAFYYGIWQHAVVGALKLAKGHNIGTGLLNKAQIDVTELVKRYPDSFEFRELLQKVTDWNNR